MDQKLVNPASPSVPTDTPRERRPVHTTAGRLLAALSASDPTSLQLLSEQLDVRERRLIECRDGQTRLEPAIQLALAKLAATLSPAHARLARQLQEQAQAALEYEDNGRQVRHLTYPRTLFR